MRENNFENTNVSETQDGILAFQLPNFDSLKDFVHLEVVYDRFVKQSIEDGYMTEDELFIARWIYKFLDLNTPDAIDIEEIHKALPKACAEAAKLFSVTEIVAEELYTKSLTIRSRNMDQSKL